MQLTKNVSNLPPHNSKMQMQSENQTITAILPQFVPYEEVVVCSEWEALNAYRYKIDCAV